MHDGDLPVVESSRRAVKTLITRPNISPTKNQNLPVATLRLTRAISCGDSSCFRIVSRPILQLELTITADEKAGILVRYKKATLPLKSHYRVLVFSFNSLACQAAVNRNVLQVPVTQ